MSLGKLILSAADLLAYQRKGTHGRTYLLPGFTATDAARFST
jgi:hypothetical protein